MQWWINTISREHVELGHDGGFTQAGHGKAAALRRLKRDDGVIFYSPRTALVGGEPLQQFTAAGIVTDDEPYQGEIAPDFHPYRRRLRFFPVTAADARPLVAELHLVTDVTHWGYPFRRGLFTIDNHDADLILTALGARN
jgi:hypothetical protein